MNRREAIKHIGVFTGAAMTRPDMLVTWEPTFSSPDTKPVDPHWEQYQDGEQVFAAAQGPTDLYSQPDINAPRVANQVVDVYPNTSDVLYSPRHMIEKETTFRLKKFNTQWGLLLNENNLYTPFTFRDSSGHEPKNLYVPLSEFLPIPQLEPINLLPDTTPQSKDIVIIRTPDPQLYLIEQDQVVMHIPVVLGSYKTPTPNGDFQITTAYLSKHMPSFPGVGYSLEIVEGTGIWIHLANWWKPNKFDKGGYGSHGCINLPDIRWHNASIHGESVSMARFVFQWAKTNLPEYDQKKTEFVQVKPTDPAAKELLPVHIMNGIDALKWVRRKQPDLGWNNVLKQIKALDDHEWLIPHIV